MTGFELATITASGIALALGIFNLIQERRTRRTANRVRAMELLDDAHLRLPRALKGDSESMSRFIGSVELAEQFDPANSRLALYQGYRFHLAGEPEQAKRQIEEALRPRNEYAPAWIVLADLSEGDDKVRCLERASQDSHTRVRAKVSLSEHYRNQNDLDRARAAADEGFRFGPKDSTTNAEMARVLWKQGELGGALDHFQRAIGYASDQQVGGAVADLGEFVAKTDNFEKGVRILERAVSVLPPGDSYALWFLTALYADEALNPLAANHASLATKALGHARAALTADPKRLVDVLEIEDEMEAVLAKSGAGDDRLGAPRD